MNFANAIVRPPGPRFAGGITTSGLGPPDLDLARRQHDAYCEALTACGLDVTALEPDPDLPDACFVEDTAVIWRGTAVLCHPGAPERQAEVDRIVPALERFFPDLYRIDQGTLDGGDVCLDNGRLLVGLSRRTSRAGAEQLARILDMPLETIDVPKSMLHLKSGLSGLGTHFLAVDGVIPNHVPVLPEDAYACNAVRVNDRVIMAAGFPRVKRVIEMLRLRPLEVDLSEFRKMDGGVSCLSLRF